MQIPEKTLNFIGTSLTIYPLKKPNIVHHIGMYIRRVTRKNKDETTVAHLPPAHNEWDPKAK